VLRSICRNRLPPQHPAGGTLRHPGRWPTFSPDRGPLHRRTLQLTYLRARFYDATMGRFLSRDPSPHCIYDPATNHPYSYAGDNPASAIDPSGQFGQLVDGTYFDTGDQPLRIALFYGALGRLANDPTDATALIQLAALGIQVAAAAPPPLLSSGDGSLGKGGGEQARNGSPNAAGALSYAGNDHPAPEPGGNHIEFTIEPEVPCGPGQTLHAVIGVPPGEGTAVGYGFDAHGHEIWTASPIGDWSDCRGVAATGGCQIVIDMAGDAITRPSAVEILWFPSQAAIDAGNTEIIYLSGGEPECR
jgi:RHS repeat-associated protein